MLRINLTRKSVATFSNGRVRNFINGEMVESSAVGSFKMIDPSNGVETGLVPLTEESEFNQVVNAAQTAFPGWKETSIMVR